MKEKLREMIKDGRLGVALSIFGIICAVIALFVGNENSYAGTAVFLVAMVIVLFINIISYNKSKK